MQALCPVSISSGICQNLLRKVILTATTHHPQSSSMVHPSTGLQGKRVKVSKSFQASGDKDSKFESSNKMCLKSNQVHHFHRFHIQNHQFVRFSFLFPKHFLQPCKAAFPLVMLWCSQSTSLKCSAHQLRNPHSCRYRVAVV